MADDFVDAPAWPDDPQRDLAEARAAVAKWRERLDEEPDTSDDKRLFFASLSGAEARERVAQARCPG